jgi:predicted nucleic acid-binding protein
VLVSAVYSPKGTAFQAFRKAVTEPYQCLLCDYCLDELRETFKKKLPYKIRDVEMFIQATLPMVELVLTPCEVHEDEEKVSDVNDRPILRTAINAEADILISGDKHFLKSGITHPLILSPAEFVNMR